MINFLIILEKLIKLDNNYHNWIILTYPRKTKLLKPLRYVAGKLKGQYRKKGHQDGGVVVRERGKICFHTDGFLLGDGAQPWHMVHMQFKSLPVMTEPTLPTCKHFVATRFVEEESPSAPKVFKPFSFSFKYSFPCIIWFPTPSNNKS